MFPQLLEVVRVNCLQGGDPLLRMCEHSAEDKAASCSPAPSSEHEAVVGHHQPAAEPNSGTDHTPGPAGQDAMQGEGKGAAAQLSAPLGWPYCRMGQSGGWVRGNTNHCLWSELLWGVLGTWLALISLLEDLPGAHNS